MTVPVTGGLQIVPAEIRYILFSADELTSAIERYAPTFPGFPVGPVVDVETVGEEDPSVTVVIREKSSQFTQVKISSDELLSFMIRVCRDARVPLPARVPKRLCVLKNRLALAIRLDARKYRPNWAPRSRPPAASRATISVTA